MTSFLLPPRPLSYACQSPTGGILRNPSPYHPASTLPQPSYPSRSNRSLSSSTSSSEDVNTPSSSLKATPPISLTNTLSLPYTSDEDHVLHPRSGSAPEYGASGSRRIRFAPLPDPRRAVLVTEHGEELPLPSVFDDDDSSGIPRPNLRNFHNTPSSSLLLGDDAVVTKEVPTITSSRSGPCAQAVRPSTSSPPSPLPTRVAESPAPSTATITSATLWSSSSSARFARRLLYPFRNKTDGSRRPGSRDSSSSRDDSPPSWSIPLTHWASADEGSRSSSMNGGSLSRIRSANATAQSKPKRMLNGRVYGARKHHCANPFDNIPDQEPEFVEWGYGGMGSVRAGGMWAKVQSDGKFFDGHAHERGRPGAPNSGADDEDDGSGMVWLKKRREERERKKREEQVAQEAASRTNAGSVPTVGLAPEAEATTTHTPSPVSADHDVTTVMPAPLRPEDDDDSSDEGDEEDESSGTEQDDDEADQEQNFKQVRGAGVERVSRHRD